MSKLARLAVLFTHSSFLIKKASDENTLIGGALARYHSGLSLTIRR